MKMKNGVIFLLWSLVLFSGCSKYVLISYENVEKTNSVEISLNSGQKVQGTIFKKEPHQLSLFNNDKEKALISKDNVLSIKRLPPVYDSFGKGISELEIEQVKTNKNKLIYGLGGGALSLVSTFFVGSMLAADSTRDAGAILGGTMGGVGIPATLLFIRAGAVKDRKDAISKINQKRISAKVGQKENDDPAKSQKLKQLQQEKEKQEELRKEREKLLEQLNKKKK